MCHDDSRGRVRRDRVADRLAVRFRDVETVLAHERDRRDLEVDERLAQDVLDDGLADLERACGVEIHLVDGATRGEELDAIHALPASVLAGDWYVDVVHCDGATGESLWFRTCRLAPGLLGALALALSFSAPASASGAFVIDIDGGIGAATADIVRSGIEKAIEADADIIVLRMDTPGGLDSAMRDIVSDILGSPVPVATRESHRGHASDEQSRRGHARRHRRRRRHRRPGPGAPRRWRRRRGGQGRA